MTVKRNCTYVAHKVNEVIANLSTITPSSPMGELSDTWSSSEGKNIWGTVPSVIEMQRRRSFRRSSRSQLQSGSLTTTFTASRRSSAYMIPNMYKIAGELPLFSCNRSFQLQALSSLVITVMLWLLNKPVLAFLCSNSVQEVMDFALISQSHS